MSNIMVAQSTDTLKMIGRFTHEQAWGNRNRQS